MRPRARLPLNRRYFHKKPKIDKKDMAFIKEKTEFLYQKNLKKELEDKERKKLRRF